MVSLCSAQALLAHFARGSRKNGLLRSQGAALSACARAKRWEVRGGSKISVESHGRNMGKTMGMDFIHTING